MDSKDSRKVLVVVTARGCGACKTYHSRDEKDVESFVSKRGDLAYQDLECADVGSGIDKIIVGVDSKGKDKYKDLTKQLGAPFAKSYYYPKFVIYDQNPLTSSSACTVFAEKPRGSYSYESISEWVADVMGSKSIERVDENDFKTKAFIQKSGQDGSRGFKKRVVHAETGESKIITMGDDEVACERNENGADVCRLIKYDVVTKNGKLHAVKKPEYR